MNKTQAKSKFNKFWDDLVSEPEICDDWSDDYYSSDSLDSATVARICDCIVTRKISDETYYSILFKLINSNDALEEYYYKEDCPDLYKIFEKAFNSFLEENSVKREGTMSSKSEKSDSGKKILARVADTVIDDGKTVALRVAAKQLPKLIADPMLNLIIQRAGLPNDDSTKGKLRAFLESDIGMGVISLMLAVGVDYLPLPDQAKDSAKDLAKEMRVQAMMTVAEPAAEMLMLPLRSVLMDGLSQLALPGFSGNETKLLSGETKVTPTLETEVVTKPVTVETKTTKSTSTKKSKKSDSDITVTEKV